MEKQHAITNFMNQFTELNINVRDFRALMSGIEAVAFYQFLQNISINTEEIEKAYSNNDKLSRMKQLRELSSGLNNLLKEAGMSDKIRRVDLTSLVIRNSLEQLENLFSNLICYSLVSVKKEDVIVRIKRMNQSDQKVINGIINFEEDNKQTYRETIEKKKKEIEELKNENIKLQDEINNIKKNITEGELISKVAELNAEMFTLEVQNKTKKEKLRHFLEVEQQITSFENEIEKSKNELLQLEDNYKNQDKYSFLNEQLELLKANQKMKYVNEIVENMSEIKKKLKVLNKQRLLMQSKIDYQHDVQVLKTRRDFLKQMVESNTLRVKRARLNLCLVEKKMKNSYYQIDMNSLI